MSTLLAHPSHALIVIAPILWLISNYFQKRLHKIPGPWMRGVTSIPRIWSVYQGTSHDDDIALHQRYGPIVRVAPNTVSVRDLAAINIIYGIGTKFEKSPFYTLSRTHDEEGLIPDTFILTDKVTHTRMKKNAANAYSLNGLVKMEPCIEPITTRLLDILDEQAEKGSAVDISSILGHYAMDAVYALTFGADLNYLKNGDVDGLLGILGKATSYMAIFGQVAWVHPLLLGNSLVSRLFFGSAQPEAGMIELAKKQIAEDTGAKDGPVTFLQQLLQNQKSNPVGITDREILTHAFGNISAGSDTTATAMRSIIYSVLKDDRVYERLCKEVRQHLKLPVTWSAAKDLPYLSAVIRESIRIHPSVGMMLARTVPREGADVCGYQLMPGVEVGVNPWVAHRDPNVFTDPDRFWPERWLAEISDDEQLRLMNRSFIAFGQGAHTCSGRWISTMETQKLIPSLLLQYDLKLADNGKAYRFINHWFTQQSGLNVQISRRRS